jgi:hemoglobin-like flavoprotein
MDTALLRTSFEAIVERQPLLTKRFYEILFERHPEVRSLFGRRPLEAQEQMLTRALVAVMDHLDDAAWFTEKLEALGAKHAGYGVTDAMYDWVGDALLATLAEVAAEDWSPALATEWGCAYRAIAATMLAGARKVSDRAA